MTVKGILERLAWMLKVRDCRHVCLWCEYYETCKAEGTEKEKRNNEKNTNRRKPV